MSSREEYNQCIKGKFSELKDIDAQQKVKFCASAKVCSGKTATLSDALKICSAPKIPKWAKELLPLDEKPLTCDMRSKRSLEALDTVVTRVTHGEADTVRPLAAQLINDVLSCHTAESGVPDLILDAMTDFNELSKKLYMTGEAKDFRNKMDIVRKAL